LQITEQQSTHIVCEPVGSVGTKEWYPQYYRGNVYYCGITVVLGPKYAGFPWGWGPVLRYYCGYRVEFFSRTWKL